MKTKLLPLLFLIVVTYTSAQNVTIPDANFKNYLVNNSSINTNGDTEIQISEAIAFTGEINVFSLGISTLSGIEEFINTTSLRAERNWLTTLDLSANLAMVDVRVKGNQLTSINLGNNTNIQILGCSQNPLTTIDVSNAINLETFHSTQNQYTTLDLSNNTALIDLRLSYNNLVSMDLTNNTLLTGIELYQNNLTSLNVANGNNTAITSFNTIGNANLQCITVDNVMHSTNHWLSKDAHTSYSIDPNCASTLGIEVVELTNFKLYPNPAKNIVNIETDSTFEQAILYNFFGKEIMRTNLKVIDISNLSSGIYIIKIKSKDEKQAIRQLVKQ